MPIRAATRRGERVRMVFLDVPVSLLTKPKNGQRSVPMARVDGEQTISGCAAGSAPRSSTAPCGPRFHRGFDHGSNPSWLRGSRPSVADDRCPAACRPCPIQICRVT